MNFENPLISGVLIKRYKRFFVDDKSKVKYYCALSKYWINDRSFNEGNKDGLLKQIIQKEN